MNNIIERLRAPFPPEIISWRVGSSGERDGQLYGMALAYIDARDVMARLDDVVGPANWQRRYSHAEAKCVCELGIRLDGEWVWKADGAGDTDYEAEKGALSDAFKRAAVNWGIGRYLYDLDSPWVRCTRKGKSVIIDKDELPRLRALLSGEKQKSAYQARKEGDFERLEKGLRNCKTLKALETFWRTNQDVISRMPDGWREALTAEKDRCKGGLTEGAAA